MSIFIQIFLVGSVKRFFPHECVSAVQSHPRSLILVPIETAYATSYYPVIVTLVLSCTVSEILQVFAPHPYSTLILGCSRCSMDAHVGVSPSYSAVKIFSKYSNLCDHGTSTSQTDRRTDGLTDGQTTYCSITALCVASRGEKTVPTTNGRLGCVMYILPPDIYTSAMRYRYTR